MKKLQYQKIRIISGKWKRKKICTIIKNTLRPTINRMKETLFNWLSIHINKAKCLDCYAGSGSLGIESLSRNAAFVTFIENNIFAYYQIKKNLSKLYLYEEYKNIKNEVLLENTILWLSKKGEPYDIIFIDPPFFKDIVNKTIYLLEKNFWIKKKSLIYIEYESSKKIEIPLDWILYRQKISKNVIYELYYKR